MNKSRFFELFDFLREIDQVVESDLLFGLDEIVHNDADSISTAAFMNFSGCSDPEYRLHSCLLGERQLGIVTVSIEFHYFLFTPAIKHSVSNHFRITYYHGA